MVVFGPRDQEDGGRLISGRTRKNVSRAARIVRLAAYSLVRSQTALGAFDRRLKVRLGPAKALTASPHKLATIVYNRLRYGKAYMDRGAAYDAQQYRQRVLKHLQRRAKQLGFELMPVIITSVADWPRPRPPFRIRLGGYLPMTPQKGLLRATPLPSPYGVPWEPSISSTRSRVHWIRSYNSGATFAASSAGTLGCSIRVAAGISCSKARRYASPTSSPKARVKKGRRNLSLPEPYTSMRPQLRRFTVMLPSLPLPHVKLTDWGK